MTVHTPPTSAEIYGCDIAAFLASVEQSLTFTLGGPGLVLMALLSDSQELICGGATVAAHQTISRAKYLICHYKLGLKLA
jgi:hypothetical protein